MRLQSFFSKLGFSCKKRFLNPLASISNVPFNSFSRISPSPFLNPLASMCSIPTKSYKELPVVTQEIFEEHGTNFYNVMKQMESELGDVVLTRFVADGEEDENAFEQVYTFHPDLIKKVFENEGPTPNAIGSTLPLFQKAAEDTNTKKGNLFLTDGEDWKKLRTVLQKNMTNPREAHKYYPIISDTVEDACQYLLQNADTPDDFATHMRHVSTDLFVTIALGRPLNLINGKARDEDLKWFNMIANDFTRLSEKITLDQDEMAIIYGAKEGPTPMFDEFKKIWEDVHIIGGKILDRALKRIEQGDEKTINSYIGKRIATMSEDGISKENLVRNTVFFLFAAVDNTSNVKRNILYNLATNPEVQETLRNQIFEVLGKDNYLEAKYLKKIPYWRDVLKETYRLTPNVNLTSRTLSEEIELGGYLIPANIPIFLSSVPYLWREDVFPNPMKFDPTRWKKVARKDRSLAHHPYMLMPGSKGKRMCPALRTAEVEISAFICRALQQYRFKLAPDSERLEKGRTETFQSINAKFDIEPL